MNAASMKKLLDRIRTIEDLRAYNLQIEALRNVKYPYVLSFLNQHAFNLACSNPKLRNAILESDCVLRDGLGLELALRALGRKSGLNCNGTDLIPEVLRGMRGRTAAVFGTKDPWLSRACRYVQEEEVKIISKIDGFKEDYVYLSAIESTKPDIIILGMGMPRQEELSVKLAQNCKHACLIINGGAVLDFMGGRFARAPKPIQRLRLEWLFRLINEPKRLFGRYAVGGAIFVIRIMKLVWHFHATSVQRRAANKD